MKALILLTLSLMTLFPLQSSYAKNCQSSEYPLLWDTVYEYVRDNGEIVSSTVLGKVLEYWSEGGGSSHTSIYVLTQEKGKISLEVSKTLRGQQPVIKTFQVNSTLESKKVDLGSQTTKFVRKVIGLSFDHLIQLKNSKEATIEFKLLKDGKTLCTGRLIIEGGH